MMQGWQCVRWLYGNHICQNSTKYIFVEPAHAGYQPSTHLGQLMPGPFVAWSCQPSWPSRWDAHPRRLCMDCHIDMLFMYIMDNPPEWSAL